MMKSSELLFKADMINIKNYSFNPSWGKIVASFENGIFDSFEFCNGDEIFYFQYIKRDIADEVATLEKNKYFDIVTPFDYGGFYYSSNEMLEKGLKEFEKKCKQENIISAFFRFNPLIKQDFNMLKNYIDIIKVQEHILIDLKSDYKKEFSSEKRRDINKQKRYDYTFIKNDSLNNFYNVYIETMGRINANEYFLFDKEILNKLLNYGKIFSINFDNNIVNSVFILEDDLNIYYFLGGGLTSYLKYGFNSLLLELVSDYYSQSKNIFLLGGGKDGLYKFKKRYSNQTAPFYIGKKIFDKEIYDKLTIKTKNKNNNFFPQYRKKII